MNVGHQSPACGLKFGEAGLLGRGHGRDLDSDTECVQGFLCSKSNYWACTYCQVRGVPLARRHPLHAGRGHGVRVRRRAGGRAARADRGALRQVLLPGGAAREARGLGRQQRPRALPAPRPAR